MAASASGVNECAYAALLMMVSRHCGYRVGVLYHLVCNEQIYSRHVDQAKEMIRRYEEKLADEKVNGEKPHPNMILNPEKTNFYDFTIDDFTLVDYDPIKPQLRFPLGI